MKKKADYTNTFCSLTKKNIKEEKLFQDSKFIDWYKRWKIRLAQNNKPYELSLNLMNLNNPLVIPRNHKVEVSLEEASNNNNLKPIHKLLKILKKPYDFNTENDDYKSPPRPNMRKYKTFCGT